MRSAPSPDLKGLGGLKAHKQSVNHALCRIDLHSDDKLILAEYIIQAKTNFDFASPHDHHMAEDSRKSASETIGQKKTFEHYDFFPINAEAVILMLVSPS